MEAEIEVRVTLLTRSAALSVKISSRRAALSVNRGANVCPFLRRVKRRDWMAARVDEGREEDSSYRRASSKVSFPKKSKGSSLVRRMHLRMQQWGDFEVWRHLRRQDMVENPRTRRVQIRRILQGHAPVDSVRERELFDEWRPQNAQAMNDMWTIFRRYAVLYAVGMIEEEQEWNDFQIRGHFRRRALLTDPNEAPSWSIWF